RRRRRRDQALHRLRLSDLSMSAPRHKHPQDPGGAETHGVVPWSPSHPSSPVHALLRSHEDRVTSCPESPPLGKRRTDRQRSKAKPPLASFSCARPSSTLAGVP